MRRRLRRGLVALLLAGAAVAPGAGAGAPGVVRGRVTLDLAGTALADVLPVVVHLEPIGTTPAGAPPAPPAVVQQRDARFAPSFVAVAAGQAVAMPNDDQIFHNVFSYSRPNDFDLGLYPAGESRSVTLRHPGTVKLYCSIHESMNGTIFVAPSPWFATVRGDGSFEIRAVPPGRWTLGTWAERLPAGRREIAVAPGASLELEVPLLPSAR